MKKVLFAAVAVLALASCKKDYVCKYNSELLPEVKYSGLKKSEAEAAESACKLAGGTWSAQ